MKSFICLLGFVLVPLCLSRFAFVIDCARIFIYLFIIKVSSATQVYLLIRAPWGEYVSAGVVSEKNKQKK